MTFLKALEFQLDAFIHPALYSLAYSLPLVDEF